MTRTREASDAECNLFHSVPIWDLSCKSKALSFELYGTNFDFPSNDVEEQFEEALITVEAPVNDWRSEDAYHRSLTSRAIIAAARGGQLRELRSIGHEPQKPFAIRALLPCWVPMEKWSHACVEWLAAAKLYACFSRTSRTYSNDISGTTVCLHVKTSKDC